MVPPPSKTTQSHYYPEEIQAFVCRNMRDEKHEQRIKADKLTPPDEV